MTGRPINESRALALITGDRTYTGAAHDKCGTTERYVSGGGCVHCARLIATEQREARKAALASGATTLAVNDVGQTEVEPIDEPVEERYLSPDEISQPWD